MTTPLTVSGTVTSNTGSMQTISGTISGGAISSSSGVHSGYTATMSSPPPPNPMCFLCIRQGRWINGVTVYQGTWLCQACATALPNTLIINELTLS